MLVTELPGNACRSSLIRKSDASARCAKPSSVEREEDERHEREEREVRHHRGQMGAPVGEEFLEQEPGAYFHGREFAPC